MTPFGGILVFSLVETVGVVVWGKILGIGAGLPAGAQLLAAGALFVFYVVEHVIAFNVGKGRAWLCFPRN